jgi:hypothetical protein
MSQFQGKWKCIKRQGDADMLKVMQVPPQIISEYEHPDYDPTYIFNFPDLTSNTTIKNLSNITNMEFTEYVPKMHGGGFNKPNTLNIVLDRPKHTYLVTDFNNNEENEENLKSSSKSSNTGKNKNTSTTSTTSNNNSTTQPNQNPQITNFLQSWYLSYDSDDGLPTLMLTHDLAREGFFHIVTKFIVSDDLLFGVSKSDCGVSSSIVLKKED